MIAGCVAGVDSMADIGTDHGYLPVYLVENELVAWAIASDTNQQPLKKAEKIISEQQLKKQIETRLGSGLSVLKPGEVDVIVMAGMGGLLIRDLLEAQPDVARQPKKMVLQPMNNQAVLRKYLPRPTFVLFAKSWPGKGIGCMRSWLPNRERWFLPIPWNTNWVLNFTSRNIRCWQL